MDHKLFTVLEVTVIGGLILAVMYFGGVFDSKPAPTLVIPTSTQGATANVPTSTPAPTRPPTRTPRPTPIPSLTPTTPPLVKATGLIAFETTRDGNTEIYSIQTDGSGETNLTHNPADDYNFIWSPDGSQIAFFSTRTGWLEVFVMDADGSNVRQLTQLEGKNAVYNPPLSWSPDGRYLLGIQSQVWGSPHTDSLQTLNLIYADGSGGWVSLYEARNGYLWQPRWSPDNRHISLSIQDDHGCRVVTAQVANLGDIPLPLQPITRNCVELSWSPDGSQIAYPEGIIYIVAPDGGEQSKIWEYSNAYGYISWAPDGQHLLYGNSNGEIDAISIDGVRHIDLNLSYWDAPGWAPDGQWLAYVGEGLKDVGILNIYDPDNRILLTDTNNNFAPQWQPRP